MPKRKAAGAAGGAPVTDNLRLNPEQRLCAKFDDASIAKFTVAKPGKMGLRVVDNCAEENMK